jgi:hypothetical protein
MSEREPDFLDDVVTEEVEQETPETPEPAAEPEAEKGVTNEPDKAAPEATPAPEVKEEHSVPYAALRAEREKRQRMERELEELRQQHQQPEPSFYENPDAFAQTIEQRATQRLYVALEATARETHADYDEVFAEVQEHAASNPAAVHQILTSPNPAMAAYKFGKQLREMKQLQDPDAYRQKIEAEVRAKVEAEYRAKEDARQKAAAAIPPDLTEHRNAKGAHAPAPESVFDEIF